MIPTAHETGEIALVCGHGALAVGPSGLGWVKSDLPVQVLSLVGLAFLLFLAGLGAGRSKLLSGTLPVVCGLWKSGLISSLYSEQFELRSSLIDGFKTCQIPLSTNYRYSNDQKG